MNKENGPTPCSNSLQSHDGSSCAETATLTDVISAEQFLEEARKESMNYYVFLDTNDSNRYRVFIVEAIDVPEFYKHQLAQPMLPNYILLSQASSAEVDEALEDEENTGYAALLQLYKDLYE